MLAETAGGCLSLCSRELLLGEDVSDSAPFPGFLDLQLRKSTLSRHVLPFFFLLFLFFFFFFFLLFFFFVRNLSLAKPLPASRVRVG